MQPAVPAPGQGSPGAAAAARPPARTAAGGGPAPRGGGRHRRHRGRRPRDGQGTASPGQHRAASRVPLNLGGFLLRAAADAAGAAVLLAGVPWALGRAAGPPLPGWRQLGETLSGPPGGMVIPVLAGAAWLLWALFAAALAAELTARACGRPVPRLPAIAPVQALAAALAGATVITVLHAPRSPARTGQSSGAVLTAAVTAAAPLPGQPGSGRPRMYRVAEGDDLWDIARRLLGTPAGWQQIYALNKGRPQPGGRTLADPRLIIPGWVLLIPRPAGHAARSPAPAPPARPGAGLPGTGQPAAPSPVPPRIAPAAGQPASRTPAPRSAAGRQAVRLPSGALTGIGVAAMVAAALTLAAVQRRRRYRPRPGLPAGLDPDPPLPAALSVLRRAARAGTAPAGPPGDGSVPLGIRGDGSPAAAGLRLSGGLGLAGPGAEPAARAVIAGLLARVPPGQAGHPPLVVIPAADAARLLPGTGPAAVPGLSVPATLEAALDEMGTLIRARGTAAAPAGVQPGTSPAVQGPVLITAGSPHAARRLAGLLDAGRTAGAGAVLLGPWPAATCQVAADGTVTASTPPDPGLDGTRLFTLGPAEAAAIAGVLQEAAGYPQDNSLAPAGSPGGHSLQPAVSVPDGNPLPGADQLPPGGGAADSPAPVQVPAGPSESAVAGTGAGGPQSRAERPVRVSVLGPLLITAGGREVAGGLRKARELLAFLAVHPDGATSEALTEALWPDADPVRGSAQRNLALRKARGMLRTATGQAAPLWIVQAGGRYRLDPALVGTDLQDFAEALLQARDAAGGDRLSACRTAAGLYRGELAEGAGYEWAEPHAETARRRALDAWTAIAELLLPSDPDQALAALEAALAHDPYNEYLYLKIMRLQTAAGRPEAARRTLALLETRLTDLGLTPSARTRQTAAALLAADRTPGNPPPAAE